MTQTPMLIWAEISPTKHSLVFPDNPHGVGFGVVQRLTSGDKVFWRWAPLLKDIYQAKNTEDFFVHDDATDKEAASAHAEASARSFGVNATLALLTRFGLRENPL